MDRTESQLCEKLRQNGYPEECVAAAVEYVKQYHYIDDLRYAKQYIRYHQQKKSSQRLKMDLMKKGVGREQIEQALAEEFVSDERAQIAELLEKRHYDAAQADRREQQRMYQFLMRRGFKSIFSTNFKINFSTISCIFVKMKCNIMHIVQLFT